MTCHLPTSQVSQPTPKVRWGPCLPANQSWAQCMKNGTAFCCCCNPTIQTNNRVAVTLSETSTISHQVTGHVISLLWLWLSICMCLSLSLKLSFQKSISQWQCLDSKKYYHMKYKWRCAKCDALHPWPGFPVTKGGWAPPIISDLEIAVCCTQICGRLSYLFTLWSKSQCPCLWAEHSILTHCIL